MAKALKKKAIILGAGLAGLSASYHSDFPVYEAKSTPGGSADSVSKNDYVFDYGAHLIHSKNNYFHELMKRVNAVFVRHNRQASIYSCGKYASYPFQINTSHMPLCERLECVLGFFFRQQRSKASNYEDWIYQNFGNGFAKKFLIPYSKKFWLVPLNEMTYEWTGQNRIPQPKGLDVIKGALKTQKGDYGPNSRFQYPSKQGSGFAGIAQAIEARCKSVTYNFKATSIDTKQQIVSFNGDHAEAKYDYLISTIPLPDLISLLPDAPKAVTEQVERLRYNSIAAVNFGIKRERITNRHWVHFPDPDISFFRISFPSNFCKGLNPYGASTIQAEVAYMGNNQPEKDTLLRQVHADLIKTGILEPDDPVVFKDVIYQKYGYVIYDAARENAVRTIHDYLKGLNIYPCGRYGEWKYKWADEAIMSGKNAAETVLGKLPEKGAS